MKLLLISFMFWISPTWAAVNGICIRQQPNQGLEVVESLGQWRPGPQGSLKTKMNFRFGDEFVVMEVLQKRLVQGTGRSFRIRIVDSRGRTIESWLAPAGLRMGIRYDCDIVEINQIGSRDEHSDLAKFYLFLNILKEDPEVKRVIDETVSAGFLPSLGLRPVMKDFRMVALGERFFLKQKYVRSQAQKISSYQISIEGNFKIVRDQLLFSNIKVSRSEENPEEVSSEKLIEILRSRRGGGSFRARRYPGVDWPGMNRQQRGYRGPLTEDELPQGRASTSGGGASGK